jgi:type I restriction enzyme M protein
MLFVKYLSDIYKEHKESLMKKYNGDIEMVERQMRYERFVLNEHASFDYIYDKRTATNIGEIINKSLADIEEENKAKLRGVFRNIDFNSEVVLGQTKERNAMLKITT